MPLQVCAALASLETRSQVASSSPSRPTPQSGTMSTLSTWNVIRFEMIETLFEFLISFLQWEKYKGPGGHFQWKVVSKLSKSKQTCKLVNNRRQNSHHIIFCIAMHWPRFCWHRRCSCSRCSLRGIICPSRHKTKIAATKVSYRTVVPPSPVIFPFSNYFH